MKTIKVIEENENEGLISLMGKRVLIMCAGYFYEGELVGVNETCVKLDDPHIVYETGAFDKKTYTDIQKIHAKSWYIQTSLIESFGESKNVQ